MFFDFHLAERGCSPAPPPPGYTNVFYRDCKPKVSYTNKWQLFLLYVFFSFFSQIHVGGRLRLKCDGTPTEITFHLSAKQTSPFKSTEASLQSTTGSRGVRISSSNAGYTMFRGSVKGTGYPLHSPVSPSLPLPCITVCHHISTGPYRHSYQLVK